MVTKKSPKATEGAGKKHKFVPQKKFQPKVAQPKKVDHFRPPAADEWRALQEGDSQSHYNFFKLQADEFLTAVHRNQERLRTIADKWLATFNSFLEGLESSEQKYDLSKRMPWLKKVAVPFEMSTSGIKGSFKFVPPKSKAAIIGSQHISASIPCDNTITVDVAVEMPKDFFQTADYLNFTYHYKKALYMSYVLVAARKSKQIDVSEAQFSFLEDDPLQPVVVLPLTKETSKVNIKVQLFFSMEAGVYKLNRFIPERNNIRAVTISPELSDELQSALNNVPTFHYNNSILRDLVLQQNHTFISTLVGKSGPVSDALILIKYWLRRRKLTPILSGYALTMLMCHLISTKKVNPTAMSHYQIIRIFFSHFHLTDMQKGVTLRDPNSTTDPSPTLAEMQLYSELCFLDVTGFQNIFAKITSNEMKRIVLESGKSLQMMDKSQTNAFQWLFLSDVPDAVVFDHIFHIVCTEGIEKQLLNPDLPRLERLASFALDSRAYLSNLIDQFLGQGLGNRIHVLQHLRVPNRSWNVADSPPGRNFSLMFGLILNPENAFDVIIKGPQANDPLANDFRAFWGEKSQLRRFKDGSVTEACVFGSSQDCPTEKRLVTSKIVEHLLNEHLSFLDGDGEPLWSHNYYANQLTCELPVDASNQKYNILDLETQSLNVIRVFNEVEMELRRLEGLPLDITGILGTSPMFYYSDPKRNYPNGYCAREANSSEVIYGDAVYDAVLTLSVSGKWPEDVEAMRRLKAAFYVEIGNRIRNQKGLFCRVAVDSVYIMRGGYTFRFRVAHSKELQLMRQSVVDGVVSYRDTSESLAMERDLFVKPTLASALHGLHQQHNAFGPTTCLVKCWLNSQLLDQTQWPDECTELLVASLFLDDTRSVTTEAPVQPQAGFLRFLHMLANKNWQTEFVLLNFNATLTAEKIDQIQSNFTMNRNQYPPVTIFTSFDDKYTGLWAKEAPILQVLVRAIMLSKELLVRLSEKIVRRDEFSNQSVFFTNFTGYDVLIHLDLDNIKFLRRNIMQSTTRLPVDFCPVDIYLKELRVRVDLHILFSEFLTFYFQSAYGDVALFFYNAIAHSKVGVLWKPSVDVPRDFRISDVNSRYLVNNQLVFDKEAICRDFLLIGHGIAEKVQ